MFMSLIRLLSPRTGGAYSFRLWVVINGSRYMALLVELATSVYVIIVFFCRSTVVDKEVFEQAVEDVLLGKGLRAASRLYGVDRDLLRASLLERGCLLGLRPSTPQEESDTPDERERESYENNSIQNTGNNK